MDPREYAKDRKGAELSRQGYVHPGLPRGDFVDHLSMKYVSHYQETPHYD